MQSLDYRVLKTDCGSIVKYNVSNYHPRKFTSDDVVPLGKSIGEIAPPYLPANPLTGEIAPEGCYYPLNSTGYKEFNYSKVKGDNWQSVKKTFSRLRDLINCNFSDPAKVLFFTFTYDPKRLNSPLTLKRFPMICAILLSVRVLVHISPILNISMLLSSKEMAIGMFIY